MRVPTFSLKIIQAVSVGSNLILEPPCAAAQYGQDARVTSKQGNTFFMLMFRLYLCIMPLPRGQETDESASRQIPRNYFKSSLSVSPMMICLSSRFHKA